MGKAEKRLATPQGAARRRASPPRSRIRLSPVGRRPRPGRLAERRAGDRHRRRRRGREPHPRAAIADPGQSVGRQAARRRQRRPLRLSSPSGRRRARRDFGRASTSSPRSRPRSRSCSCRAAGRGRSRQFVQDRESSGAEAENKKNIAYHYDVSNAFYQLWLDKEMVYTCAYFHDWGDSLDAAQTQKLDMICRKLRLKPGETMLDIGSGWGALACHAARHYGVEGHRRDAVGAADRLRPRQDSGGSASPTR